MIRLQSDDSKLNKLIEANLGMQELNWVFADIWFNHSHSLYSFHLNLVYTNCFIWRYV